MQTELYAHPNSNARLLEYDLTKFRPLITRAAASVQSQLDERPPLPSMYGRERRMNRNHGFFCEREASYGYFFSKQVALAKDLTPALSELLSVTNKLLGTDYNGILVNEYMNGEDYISDHRDDEDSLVQSHAVFSISLGAERKFRLKVWDETKNQPHPHKTHPFKDFVTKSCHGLMMTGSDFQRLLSHGIPKEKNVKDRRISFTFRKHNKAKEEKLYKAVLKKSIGKKS